MTKAYIDINGTLSVMLDDGFGLAYDKQLNLDDVPKATREVMQLIRPRVEEAIRHVVKEHMINLAAFEKTELTEGMKIEARRIPLGVAACQFRNCGGTMFWVPSIDRYICDICGKRVWHVEINGLAGCSPHCRATVVVEEEEC